MPSVKSVSAARLNEWHAFVSCVISLAQTSSVLQTYAFTKTWLASVAIQPLLCMWTHHFFFLKWPFKRINNIVFTATLMTRAQWSSQGFLGAFLGATVFSVRPWTMLIQLSWIPWMKRTESMWTKCQSIPQTALSTVLLFIYLFIHSVSRWPLLFNWQVWHIVKKGKWKNPIFLRSLSVDTLLQVQIKGCLHLRFPCT